MAMFIVFQNWLYCPYWDKRIVHHRQIDENDSHINRYSDCQEDKFMTNRINKRTWMRKEHKSSGNYDNCHLTIQQKKDAAIMLWTGHYILIHKYINLTTPCRIYVQIERLHNPNIKIFHPQLPTLGSNPSWVMIAIDAHHDYSLRNRNGCANLLRFSMRS